MEKSERLRSVSDSFYMHFATLMILLIALILTTNSINAQTKTDSSNQSNDLVNRHFRKIPIPPGVKTDFDNILISRFGGIWAKSKSTGLAYYDGTEMKVYRHSKTDSNSISSDMIFSIAEDEEGNLYAATWDGGLNIINKTNGHITKIIFRDSIEQYKIAAQMSICFDEQHNLFIGLFGRGFLLYNTLSGSVKHFNLDPSKRGNWFLGLGNSVALMEQDPLEKNIIWMLTNMGQLYSFNRNTLQVQKVFSGEIAYPRNMFIKGADIFFAAGPNRIYNKITKQVRPVKRYKDWGWVTPYKKSDDELYCYYNPFEVITYNIHSENFTSYKLPSFGLSEMSTVTSFMNDGKDNLWMIADGELYYSSAQYSLFSNFNIFDSTSRSIMKRGGNNYITDIKWDPVNHWYYLFYSNWVYVLDEKLLPLKSIDLLNLPPLILSTYRSILIDNDRLWILGDRLHIWDKTKKYALPYSEYFGKEFPSIKGDIISMAKGRNNILFFYTNEQNLYSFETNAFRLEFLGNLKNKEAEFPDFLIGYDSLSNNLFLYSGIHGYSTIFEVSSRKMYDLNSTAFRLKYKMDGGRGCYDTDGYFWIKGSNPVLYKLDQKMKIVDSVTALQSMLPDIDVTIKLIGKDSLMIYEGNQCLLFHTKKRTFTLVNADNGAFRMRQAGTYYFTNEHIFYSTSLLLQFASLNKFIDVPGKPQVYIAEMKSGKDKFEMPGTGAPHFKYDQNNLSFVMSAVEMNFPERIQYAYRLVNFNDDWTFTDFYNRNIVYTNLPPGKFTLQIKARTQGQEWEEAKNFTFIITPPFWQTWWFMILAGLLFIGIVFFFIRKNIERVRKKEQQKLLHEKELLELEAKALRAQMNPHFIFNSLNSIKSLINKNENDKAANYLTTFSKLIRTLFQNSHKREVSLFEEIETCKLYTQLERMRFGDKVEFIFKVDETIDLKDIKVPALILQPFIENAIWHGLVPKETGGRIVFSVKETNNTIECIIDDNGIGRKLSSEYNAEYKATHQSKGIGMTQSRLELDKLLNERDDEIAFIDKTDTNGNSLGTTVIIKFKEN